VSGRKVVRTTALVLSAAALLSASFAAVSDEIDSKRNSGAVASVSASSLVSGANAKAIIGTGYQADAIIGTGYQATSVIGAGKR
jgi:hypothetical protein